MCAGGIHQNGSEMAQNISASHPIRIAVPKSQLPKTMQAKPLRGGATTIAKIVGKDGFM
jgi:hypothetical protein